VNENEIRKIDAQLFRASIAKKEKELEKKLLEEKYKGFFEELNKLEEEKKNVENRIEVLKTSLLSMYGDFGEPPLGVHHSVVSHQGYVIESERAVPREYCSPDRGKISQDIKNGIIIPGIKVIRTRIIRIK